MKPRRIKLSRTKGSFVPPNTVAVVRPTKWGNPFVVGKHGTRLQCIAQYAAHVLANPTLLADIKRELAGKNLACYCKLSEPCHADFLLNLANSDPELILDQYKA